MSNIKPVVNINWRYFVLPYNINYTHLNLQCSCVVTNYKHTININIKHNCFQKKTKKKHQKISEIPWWIILPGIDVTAVACHFCDITTSLYCFINQTDAHALNSEFTWLNNWTSSKLQCIQNLTGKIQDYKS